MVIGIKEGTSSYEHIPVFELTPAQLAENKRQAEGLGERLLRSTKQLPEDFEALGIEPKRLRRIALAHTKLYMQYDHFTPSKYEEDHNRLIKNILTHWESEQELFKVLKRKETVFDEKKFSAFLQRRVDPMLEEIDAIFPVKSRDSLIRAATTPIHFVRKKAIATDCLTRFNARSLCEEITADHDVSLEDAIAQEQRNRTLQLNSLDALSAKENLGFEAYRLGKNRAHHVRRIISGADAIIADYLPLEERINTKKIYCFDTQHSKGKQKLSYRFGFIKDVIPANDGNEPYLYIGAAYFIDPRLLNQLKEQRGDDHLDARILTGFLTAARLADHDYFHHLTVSFYGDGLGSPLKPSAFDEKYHDINTDEMIGRLTKEGPLDNSTLYEKQSIALHYLAMQELFERQPRIKTRVIEQAVNFLEMAQEFRDRLAKSRTLHNKKVEESAQFLAQIYTDRLFHALPYADIDTKVKDQNGALTTLREQWDGLYHKSHPKLEIATFIESIKIIPRDERTGVKRDQEERKQWAQHKKAIKAVHKEHQSKNAQLRKFEYGYFLGKDGLVEQLEHTLASEALTHMVDKERLQEMSEQVATFKLLMQQLANRAEVGTVHLVGEPVMHSDGIYVFRAIKDRLPQAADQIMGIASEVQDAGDYDMQSIAEKLARLKDTWRETTEQKAAARI